MIKIKTAMLNTVFNMTTLYCKDRG